MDGLSRFDSGVTVVTPGTGSNLASIGHGSTLLFIDAGTVPTASRLFRSSVAPDHAHETIVVLTHHHADHVFGTAGLKADRVIASARAAELIEQRGDSERDHLMAVIPDARAELESTAVPLVGELVTAERELDLGDRSVSLIPVGHAHTPGDLAVFDPLTETLFTGDLASNGLVPVFRDADSGGWLRALQQLRELNPRRVVPGHGPVGTASLLDVVIDLLETLRELVSEKRTDAELTLELDKLPTRFHGLQRPERLTPAARVIAAEYASAEASRTN